MNSARMPEVADIGSSHPAPPPASSERHRNSPRPVEQLAAVQDRLASWLSDLTTLQELNERLTRSDSLDTTLHELLHAGAALVGAQRGVVVLEPADGQGPEISVGLGLEHSDLGTLETVPRAATCYGRVLDAEIADSGTERPEGADGVPPELINGNIAADPALHPRHREVAEQLGVSASYARQLICEATGALGCVVWMYDEPATPTERQRHLAGLYCGFASELVAKQLRIARTERAARALREELLPPRLPWVPGVGLAVRHRVGQRGGGDWYDALLLPEDALGLSVGGVTGQGPAAEAAMLRLRTSLRAYAVMEGEDPVAVLSDLELLLHFTEPARTATALYAYVDPAARRLTLAGAGQCPPLLIGERGARFVETSLSAPLGMLSCWEAPSVELSPSPGETLVLYTDGLLHRCGGPLDQAFARLQTAASRAPMDAREDPEMMCDYLLAACVPDGTEAPQGPLPAPGGEDVVVLAARFG